MSKPHIWFDRRYSLWCCGPRMAMLHHSEGMLGATPSDAFAKWVRHLKRTTVVTVPSHYLPPLVQLPVPWVIKGEQP